MTWSTRQVNDAVFHQLDLQNPIPFATKGGQALDASVWHAMGDQVRLITTLGEDV